MIAFFCWLGLGAAGIIVLSWVLSFMDELLSLNKSLRGDDDEDIRD
jgi:hypothetical protein